MQLLHVTDLHYTSDQPFQRAVIEALIRDVRQRVSDGFSPEFVIFSGDIVHNPDEERIYETFEQTLLKPLLATVNLTEKHTIFCPGNHDISRKTVEQWSALSNFLANSSPN